MGPKTKGKKSGLASPSAENREDSNSEQWMEEVRELMAELKNDILQTLREEINSTLKPQSEETKKLTDSLEEANQKIKDLESDKCNLEQRVNDLTVKIENFKQKEVAIEQKFDQLTDRQITNEAYGRRENLLIYGVEEKDEEICETVLKNFMLTQLNIPEAKIETIKLQRCHRLKSNLSPKPIICRFMYYPDRMCVWKARSNLKGTPYSLSEDFPPEIVSRRKILYPIFKAAKNDKAKCQLIGDKLYLEGKLYTVKNLQELPVKYDPTALATVEKNGITAFFTKASPLSNFHPCALDIDGRNYSCVEQYYQEQKALFGERPDVASQIRNATDPAKCKSLGGKVTVDDEKWLPTATQVMRKACRIKFVKYDDMKQYLLQTKNNVIAEASRDTTWGTGTKLSDASTFVRKDWKGKNYLGEILMNIRTELQ